MLLGDFIAEFTKKIGAKPCIPCQERQTKMNQWDQRFREKIKTILSGSHGS